MKKIITCFLFLMCCLHFTTNASAKVSDEELANALQRILLEKPEIIINVLRQNSELVLDIAQEGSNNKRKRSLMAQWSKDKLEKKEVRLEGRPVLGPENASITVVEFSDFTCPYCAQAAATVKKLMADYKGKVKLIFKPTPLSGGEVSIKASEYFIAAGFQSNEKAWKLYSACFEERGKLIEQGEAFLKAKVKELKLDLNRLVKDINSSKVKKILQADLEDAKKLNVEGTPYFLVNNIVVRGALPYELFKSAFDLALEK